MGCYSIVNIFSEYYKSSYNTSLSIGGTMQKPSPDAVLKVLPGESSKVDHWIAWQEWFWSHCFEYCPQAWPAWLTEKVVYLISPTAEDLALFIEDRKYIGDKTKFSVKEIMGSLSERVKDNLTKSTQNTITYYCYHWLDTQLRKAASKVKILVGQVQSIPVKNFNFAWTTWLQNFCRRTEVGLFQLR
jgi:hypothetical protein